MPAKPHTVVLADDDPDDIAVFQETVKTLCPAVKLLVAEDGKKLLQLLEGNKLPNLIVLDINMPVINGLDTLKNIRKNARYDKVPVMMYTSSKNKEEMNECIKNGADYYAVKSSNYRDISNLINGICRGIWNSRFSI